MPVLTGIMKDAQGVYFIRDEVQVVFLREPAIRQQSLSVHCGKSGHNQCLLRLERVKLTCSTDRVTGIRENDHFDLHMTISRVLHG